jgi:hypothetical protein
VKTVFGAAYITHCVPGLAPAPAPALAPVSVLARAWRPCLAVVHPGPAILASAAHAGPTATVALAGDPEHPGAPVVVRPGLASECFRRPFAVRLRAGGLGDPACVAQNAGYSAARNLALQTLPVFPAGVSPAEQAPLALPAPDSVAARWGHAAGNGNSAFESPAAALLAGDTDPLNTAAGRQAAGQVPGPRGGSICPSRCCAVPNLGPSNDPNVAAHHAATRGSVREAGGSNAQGCAG